MVINGPTGASEPTLSSSTCFPCHLSVGRELA
jgi:hypothetical protein